VSCSEFIDYLVTHERHGSKRLPPLSQISEETHLGVGKLREQMAVAKALGLIDVAPRRGIEALNYDFLPAVRASLEAGMALDESCFLEFADLRMSLESSFWVNAVASMTDADLQRLAQLCREAHAKLNGTPVEIPRAEHREFHLTVFRNLDNPFVLALLTAYWDVYQTVAPKYYEELAHLQEIWVYHQTIVDALQAGDIPRSLEQHIKHMQLLEVRRNHVAGSLRNAAPAVARAGT